MLEILFATTADDLPFFTSSAAVAIFYGIIGLIGLALLNLVLIGYIANKVADSPDMLWRKKRRKQELKDVFLEALDERADT